MVVDREETLLSGADNSIYAGSLRRLVENRGELPIIPIQGDATAFPIASGSLDAIVSCQLLEHLEPDARAKFFMECARCLRPGGVLTISTPSAAMYDVYKFWLSPLSRRLISEGKRTSIPRSLQGPWLLQSLEEWEARVGHFGHGCPESQLNEHALKAGFVQIDSRGTHTKLTAFWFEAACTLPLLAMIASPLVRTLYEVEWRMPASAGVNLMMKFKKPATPGLETT